MTRPAATTAALSTLTTREINALRDQYATPAAVPVDLREEIRRRNAAGEERARRLREPSRGTPAAAWFAGQSFCGRPELLPKGGS